MIAPTTSNHYLHNWALSLALYHCGACKGIPYPQFCNINDIALRRSQQPKGKYFNVQRSTISDRNDNNYRLYAGSETGLRESDRRSVSYKPHQPILRVIQQPNYASLLRSQGRWEGLRRGQGRRVQGRRRDRRGRG